MKMIEMKRPELLIRNHSIRAVTQDIFLSENWGLKNLKMETDDHYVHIKRFEAYSEQLLTVDLSEIDQMSFVCDLKEKDD